ncbi:RDH54 [[Candida] subhashii]|uniref:RDH54 n=1 Tax=[Candida] subhashii TaxID=561895 RepID=A0A8J5UK37_9ASCO|nr:RDH54 [[Candida] subhashii]KAG7661636.1 RDH54 [[Candida] subhashii]
MYNTKPNAPFRPPRLIRKIDSNGSSLSPPSSSGSSQSYAPKRDAEICTKPIPRPTLQAHPIANNTQPLPKKQKPSPDPTESSHDKYLVQWRKRTTKKNKTWDGDGYATIVVAANTNQVMISLRSQDGKPMGKKQFNSLPNLDEVIVIGGYEFEIDEKVSSSQVASSGVADKESSSSPAKPKVVSTGFKKVAPQNYTQSPDFNVRKPLYENNANGIALPDPPNCPKFVKVHVDPILATKLRPHQIEGVTFLYECLLGYRNFKGKGCLLADEMGLGKTLMTIATIWTLLKQNPFIDQKKPIVNKVLIVCPVTLINNWRSEFRKWLGMNKVNVLTLGNSSNEKLDIINFGKLNVYQVLIINYEKVTAHYKELASVGFELLVCDEGHRLKNSSNKVLNHLIKLKIPRKIVLTGTPIQNYLLEFHTLISFLNPGVLPDLKNFQKKFVNPILRARDINCFDQEIKRQGEEISNQLIELTKPFILRRTQQILKNYLTTKTDILLFVPPTPLQLKLFDHIISLKNFNEMFSGPASFTMINMFKKICNSPSLLKNDDFFTKLINEDPTSSAFLQSNPLSTASGKINMLIPLLLEITTRGEKIVVVSNYTQTLNLLEIILQKLNLTFSRLDGSTPHNVRNKLVNQFNKTPSISVFLLSSKSGGMGINLTGASRLILFDNDWNPANDIQSMSRIHRDGQQKPCYIYRLFTTGCIDEKIFQRQLMKNKLSDKFLDGGQDKGGDAFDYEDLRNLFMVESGSRCNTHDLLCCDCGGDGSLASQEIENDDDDTEPVLATTMPSWMSARELQTNLNENENGNGGKKKKSMRLALGDYRHYDPKVCVDTEFDSVLSSIVNHESFNEKRVVPVTFIMSKISEQVEDADEALDEVGEKENVDVSPVDDKQV